MTVAIIQELAAEYIRPEQMIFLIVGDAESQLEHLQQLGFETPTKLN